MTDYERRNIEDFFKAIEPNLPGYQHSHFSYLALKKGEAFELAQGRLQLQGVPAPIPSGCFQSENIKAGIFRLSEVNLTPRGFVEGLLTGTLRTPQTELSCFLIQTAYTQKLRRLCDASRIRHSLTHLRPVWV